MVLLKKEQVHGHFQSYCLLLRCCCYHLNWVIGSYCGYSHCHFHCRWSDLDWDLDPDMLLKNERSNPQLYCSKDNNKSTQLWLVYVKVNFKARFTVSLEVVGKINIVIQPEVILLVFTSYSSRCFT